MSGAVAAWERFWFEPEPTSALALVRIAFGLLCLLWALSVLPDLATLFSSDGVLQEQPANQGDGVWGLLQITSSPAAVLALCIAMIVASIALVLGLWTRLAALVVFLALMSFTRRNAFALNSGDGLVRIIALYLVLSPAGASLSLDRLRRARDRFWEFPARAPWALRLIQVQLSVVYLSTVWQKARGTTWNDGTAVSYSLRLEDLERLPVPDVLAESITLSNFATFGTLALELAIGILVWNRRARPWLLLLGVGMHLSIDYALHVGFFSYAIFVCYLAFLPPETVSAWLIRLRDRLSASRTTRVTA
jgi:uncharacterized membrane protein YphA (DoxX/SURF4 family)